MLRADALHLGTLIGVECSHPRSAQFDDAAECSHYGIPARSMQMTMIPNVLDLKLRPNRLGNVLVDGARVDQRRLSSAIGLDLAEECEGTRRIGKIGHFIVLRDTQMARVPSGLVDARYDLTPWTDAAKVRAPGVSEAVSGNGVEFFRSAEIKAAKENRSVTALKHFQFLRHAVHKLQQRFSLSGGDHRWQLLLVKKHQAILDTRSRETGQGLLLCSRRKIASIR